MRSVSFFCGRIKCIVSIFLSGIIFLTLIMIALIKLFYPVCYIDSINDFSKKYELEPALIFAIVNTESGFNRFAISSRGAIGLMQLMPATAQFIACELKIKNFNDDQLFDSNTNIEFGCFYLRYLSNKFDTDEKILFAYNAGEGRLLNHLKNNNGVFNIDDIEIVETKNYIINVKMAQSIYKNYHNL